MYGTRVLVLLPLLVGLAHCFSWEIVVGEGKLLKFYNNGTLTHTEDIPSAKAIRGVVYDPVHFRVLFADRDYPNKTVSSYDLTTGKIKTLVTLYGHLYYGNIAYDPLKQLLFLSTDTKVYSISLLTPASANTTVDGNLILTLENECKGLAVDSIGGYIYLATDFQIEKAAFDGSKREVLVVSRVHFRRSLIIDQQTKTMFWCDEYNNNHHSIESADLSGKNGKTFYLIGNEYGAGALTVSNDYIYWISYDQSAILRLPKHQQNGVAPTVYTNSSRELWYFPITATNYTIEEQTLAMNTSEDLQSLTHNSTANNTSETELQCSPCLNYCFAGSCSISAEGLPNCSCEAGHTGERCEVDVCHKHCLHGGVCSLNEKEEPVCQCTAGYEGERCDVATTTTCAQAENTKQEIRQDVCREIKQVIVEELKRVLQVLSDIKD